MGSLTFHTCCCVLLTTLSAMLMGYDVGIISGAILFITEEMQLSVWKEEMIVGSLNIVAAFGAIVAGFFANRFGRRSTLEFAALVFFVGAVLLAAAPNFESLMAGRILAGIGVGFAMMIGPLYSAEISPANVRGFLVSFTEIFVDVGIVLGYIVGFAFQFLDPKYNWRLMLGVAAIPAVLLGLGTIFLLPESPRWLVMRGRYDEAMCVLEKTVCTGSDAQERLEEIIDANELELAGTSSEFNGWRKLQFSNITEMCCSPSFRSLAKMYCAAIGINFFQQAAGIEATVYYSPMIFKVAGVTSRLGMLGATLCVGVVKLGFVLVATFTLDKVGRKKLLMLSSAGMVASLIVVCATFKVNGINIDATSTSGVVHGGLGIPWSVVLHSVPAVAESNNAVSGAAISTMVAICSFVAFFSMGWGPIVYVISSEIFPPKHRSKALGWSMFVNRVVSGAVAFTFLTISQAITLTGTFAIFCATTVVSVVFTAYIVPETKGKTLEELGGACSAASLPCRGSSTSHLDTPLIS